MTAGCAPRPSRTWRSTQLKQAFRLASGNQRPYGPDPASKIVVGGVIQSIALAASPQKASGSCRQDA